MIKVLVTHEIAHASGVALERRTCKKNNDEKGAGGHVPPGAVAAVQITSRCRRVRTIMAVADVG